MAYTCPCCQRVSHNINDELNGYCGACHWYTRDSWLRCPEHRAAIQAAERKWRIVTLLGCLALLAGAFAALVLAQFGPEDGLWKHVPLGIELAALVLMVIGNINLFRLNDQLWLKPSNSSPKN